MPWAASQVAWAGPGVLDFLPGDLAIRKAVQAAYRLDHLPVQQEVLAIADKWWPYRGLATSYLFSAASTRSGYQTFMPPSTTRSTPVT